MQVSPLIELVWHIASREAIAASWGKIKSEHFLLGILKVSEISDKELASGFYQNQEGVKVLLDELNTIRTFFKDKGINSTLLRREVRTKLGQGNKPYNGGILHREDECRELFEKAMDKSKKEGNNMLTLLDLFKVFAKSVTGESAQTTVTKEKQPDGLLSKLTSFTADAGKYITPGKEKTLDNHPVHKALKKRLTDMKKGMVIFFDDLNFIMEQLAYTCFKVAEEKKLNLYQMPRSDNINRDDINQLFDHFVMNDNGYLLLPEINITENTNLIFELLNQHYSDYTYPLKTICLIKSDIRKWWKEEFPRTTQNSYVMYVYSGSHYQNNSVENV